ncbi:hypothetical protein V5O48_015048 [Marasmius crinis-equi]|uniref:Uncharacterized protein n=1 Tax=Marasmius crinis-equi TaxID=585013 RepID=A0ABR3EVM6_9AGAR
MLTTSLSMIFTALVASNLAIAPGAFAQKCRQPSEYAAVIQSFGAMLVEPNSVLNGSVPAPWAPGVIGRVDITTTFIGNDLNTEYVFGLFAEANDLNTTQIIGVPTKVTLAELVVQPPMVWASVIVDIFQKTISTTIPIQFDFAVRFDENLLISSYDATIRRFPQAIKYVTPKLAVQMAQELNVTITATTDVVKDIVTRRAAIDICQLETQYCTGDNQQYTKPVGAAIYTRIC